MTDQQGYVDWPQNNLMQGVRLDHFESDLRGVPALRKRCSPDFVNDADAQKHFAQLKTLLDEVNVEDRGCTERVFKGLSAGAAKAGHLSHLERPNFDFAQYLAERTGGFTRKFETSVA